MLYSHVLVVPVNFFMNLSIFSSSYTDFEGIVLVNRQKVTICWVSLVPVPQADSFVSGGQEDSSTVGILAVFVIAVSEILSSHD